MSSPIFSFIVAEGVAAVLALVVLLLAAVLAYVVFKMLKKSLKMAVRLALAVAILAVGLIGAGVFWWMSSGSETPPRQSAPANRKR